MDPNNNKENIGRKTDVLALALGCIWEIAPSATMTTGSICWRLDHNIINLNQFCLF